MPAISVIMPVYNTQQYLNRSIRSLMSQSFADFELILINDGSTDYSLLYSRALAKQDSRIRVLDLPHGGIVAARIAGLAAARGDYVGFVDSDDFVEQDFLLHLYHAIRTEDADISMCQYVCQYGKRSLAHSSFPSGTYQGEGLRKLILSDYFCNADRIPGRLPLFLWNKLFKRTLLLDNIKYLDYRLAAEEDMLLFYSCLLSSKGFTVIGDCDYHYCRRSDSTARNKTAVFDCILRFRNLAKAMLEEKGFAELAYRVDTKTLYQIASIIANRSKEMIQPLPTELMELIKAQSNTDGCDQWRAAVKTVTEYYLSESSDMMSGI